MNAEFSLYLKVDDEAELAKAAAARAVADGAYETEEEYLADPENGIREHLVMLLDPGSLAGCSIFDSTAEVA